MSHCRVICGAAAPAEEMAAFVEGGLENQGETQPHIKNELRKSDSHQIRIRIRTPQSNPLTGTTGEGSRAALQGRRGGEGRAAHILPAS